MENCSSWLRLSLAPGPLPKDNHFLSFLLILLDVSSVFITIPCNSVRSGSAKFKAVPQIREERGLFAQCLLEYGLSPPGLRENPRFRQQEGETNKRAQNNNNNLKAHISAFSLKGDFKRLSLKTYTCTFFAKTSSQPERGWSCRTRASQPCVCQLFPLQDWQATGWQLEVSATYTHTCDSRLIAVYTFTCYQFAFLISVHFLICPFPLSYYLNMVKSY